MPKISIIVPVYNTEKYLEECLDSVISQTLCDIEIIIINDNSPDNAISIIDYYANKDNRIIVIDKKANEGVGKARNDGIKASKGEYIAFLDSDDMFSNEQVLEKLYIAATKYNVSITGGLLERLYPDGHIEKDSQSIRVNNIEYSSSGLTEYKDFQYDYGYCCYIYSRELIVSKKIEFPLYTRFQDPPFFVRAMFESKRFYMLNDCVYRYRYIDNEEKYTLKKTMDQLQGVMDNLVFSKVHNLPKLHYISAVRLNTECGYMVSKNLESSEKYNMIRKLIDANALVDEEWLNDEGIMIKPFVLDFFKYVVETAGKYEKLRNKRIIKPIRRLLGKYNKCL